MDMSISYKGMSNKYFLFIKVQLIYNVVLISAVQESDSALHTYTFFFIMVYPRKLKTLSLRSRGGDIDSISDEKYIKELVDMFQNQYIRKKTILLGYVEVTAIPFPWSA